MQQEIFVNMDNLDDFVKAFRHTPPRWLRLLDWLLGVRALVMLIIPGCFALLIALALAAIFRLGPFSAPMPLPPVSITSQCQQTGNWCLGATCGGCERGKPATFDGLGL